MVALAVGASGLIVGSGRAGPAGFTEAAPAAPVAGTGMTALVPAAPLAAGLTLPVVVVTGGVTGLGVATAGFAAGAGGALGSLPHALQPAIAARAEAQTIDEVARCPLAAVRARAA